MDIRTDTRTPRSVSPAASRRAAHAAEPSTRVLVTAGVVAGPLFVLVGLVQVLTREGFDLTRHPLSLLALGDLGWIQIANFIVAGVLMLAFALGAVGAWATDPVGSGRPCSSASTASASCSAARSPRTPPSGSRWARPTATPPNGPSTARCTRSQRRSRSSRSSR